MHVVLVWWLTSFHDQVSCKEWFMSGAILRNILNTKGWKPGKQHPSWKADFELAAQLVKRVEGELPLSTPHCLQVGFLSEAQTLFKNANRSPT